MRRWRFWRLCRSSFRERTANSKSKDLRREHGGKLEKNLRKIAALTPQALRTQRKLTPQKTKHRENQLPRLPDSVKLVLRRDVTQHTLARACARGRGAKKSGSREVREPLIALRGTSVVTGSAESPARIRWG